MVLPCGIVRMNCLSDFRGFRVYRYEEVIAKPDWGKSDVRIVKFVAEKPLTN